MRVSYAQRRWTGFTASFKPILAVYVIATLAVSLQQWLMPLKTFDGNAFYPDFNNYAIFRQSFFHLLEAKDLYKLYPAEYWDLFKYSPSFALLFAPLAVLPDLAGIMVWTALNALILFVAIRDLPVISREKKISILLFVLIELVTSLQNMQSNGLIAGLIVLGFVQLEKGNAFAGIACIVLSGFIKIFGILALGLLLFYPNKPKMILYCAVTFVVLLLLPLVIVSTDQLITSYASWWDLLSHDHAAAYGISLLGWLKTWFHLDPGKDVVVLVGLLLLGLPFLWWKRYDEYLFRLHVLSGILVWLVIFNHMAESPTYVIAAVGAAIWYFEKPRGVGDTVLIALFFLFTILSQTDLFPGGFRSRWLEPYVIKAVPAILVWFRITFEAIFWRKTA